MVAPEQTLEALVKDELRGPVSELVQRVVLELVHEQLNGAGPSAGTVPPRSQLPQETTNGPAATPDPPTRGKASTTKTCKVCAETKPASAFDRHRHTCKRCRRNQEHERVARRQATDDEELPRTAPRPVDEGA